MNTWHQKVSEYKHLYHTLRLMHADMNSGTEAGWQAIGRHYGIIRQIDNLRAELGESTANRIEHVIDLAIEYLKA